MPVCPWRVVPTWTVPVTAGFAVTGIVPGETVTAADAARRRRDAGGGPGDGRDQRLARQGGRTTNEVLSSVPGTGVPAGGPPDRVDVGVGLQLPRSSVTVPPTVAVPPIAGVPTVVKGWGVGGVKSTLTAAPAAPTR